MKLITLSGGLGNQMFQYAFYLMMKKHHRGVFLTLRKLRRMNEHNGYELEHIFPIRFRGVERFMMNITQTPLLGGIVSHLFFPIKYRERVYYSPLSNSQIHSSRYACARFVGYWQSEDYFKEVSEEIRQAFRFRTELANSRTLSFSRQLRRLPGSVSIHIRRGDYFSNPEIIRSYGCICGEDYYRRAVDYILQKVSNPRFFIFTDDMTWCKQHLKINHPATFIDWNTKNESWQDMYLMSCCHHQIIANSSFSWWAAWLNPSPDKIIICPDRWTTTQESPQATPDQWIKIPTQS